MNIQRVFHSLLVICVIVCQVMAQQSPSAQDYVKTAVEKVQKADLDNAIKDLTKAIELDPRNVSAFFIRAQCFFVKGDGDRALLDECDVLNHNNCLLIKYCRQ